MQLISSYYDIFRFLYGSLLFVLLLSTVPAPRAIGVVKDLQKNGSKPSQGGGQGRSRVFKPKAGQGWSSFSYIPKNTLLQQSNSEEHFKVVSIFSFIVSQSIIYRIHRFTGNIIGVKKTQKRRLGTNITGGKICFLLQLFAVSWQQRLLATSLVFFHLLSILSTSKFPLIHQISFPK